MVCSDHFKESDIKREGKRVRLKRGAVPTRFKSSSYYLSLDSADPLTPILHDHTYSKRGSEDDCVAKSTKKDGDESVTNEEGIDCDIDTECIVRDEKVVVGHVGVTKNVCVEVYDDEIVEDHDGEIVVSEEFEYFDMLSDVNDTNGLKNPVSDIVETQVETGEVELPEQMLSVVCKISDVSAVSMEGGALPSDVVVDVVEDEVVDHQESGVKNTKVVVQKGHRHIQSLSIGS